jgi:nucleotide-binding universal stress UspA family protein
MLPLHTLLHPTDFSERSEYAFRLACSLARDYGARLVVLHVVTPPVVIYGEGVVPPEPEMFRAEAQEKLNRLEAPAPGVGMERRLTEGDPVAEILRLARESGADLIVLGTHGRTGLGRLLMGSVAEQVVRQAPCPVLTIRMPFAEAVSVPAGAPLAATIEQGRSPELGSGMATMPQRG